MGNECCSNDAIREQGGLSTMIELKKPKAKRDVKLTSNTNIATAPNSPAYQQTPQNIQKWSLDEQYKSFIQKFRQIRNKINKTVNQQKSLLSKRKWQESLEQFDKYYLTLSDRHELTNLMYKILKVEFSRPFTQKQIDEEFLQKIDELDMSQQIGYKLKSLKQRIKYRKSQALEYLEFLKQFSSYSVDFSDIKKIARRVHEFCQKDINAFSFITLYLINCTNLQLNNNPSSIFEIIDKLKAILNELSVQYPPSSVEVQQQYENDDLDRDMFNQAQTLDVNYQTCIRYPMIKFTQDNYENKVEQIQAYIMKKARQAKKDKTTFHHILRPVCMKRGNHFQSALKIKSSSDEEILSVIRTIEKIVFKEHADECRQQLEKMKQEITRQIQQTEDFNKLGAFVQKWTQSIDQAEKKILQGKITIPFNVGDLLRAKAMFRSRADISKTVKDIEEALQKWPKDKYTILKTQDRLQKPTKDFKMLLQMGDTIAELQLAKQTNKASNEFNHKIYELKRSKAFTPLFNLMIINERLSEIFFTDLLEFLFFMIDFQEPEFTNGQEELQKFTEDYLAKNVSAFADNEEYDAENRLFTKDQATLKEETDLKLSEISQMLKLGYSINGYYERDNIRKTNDQNFMK